MIKLEYLAEEIVVAVPPPKKTDSYTPIHNRRIIDLIREQASLNNLSVIDSKFKMNSDGTQTLGLFDFYSNDNDMGIRGTFLNSYDKSLSFKFSMGGVVWKCSNGCFSTEVYLKRKHTGDAEQVAKMKIISGFEMMGEYFQSLLDARNKLMSVEVDIRKASELVGRMFMEHEFITSQQMNVIKKGCQDSSLFASIFEPGYSAWDLYNNVTHSLKQSHPSDYMDDHINFHNFMIEEFK